jgi:hypothetical protein
MRPGDFVGTPYHYDGLRISCVNGQAKSANATLWDSQSNEDDKIDKGFAVSLESNATNITGNLDNILS